VVLKIHYDILCELNLKKVPYHKRLFKKFFIFRVVIKKTKSYKKLAVILFGIGSPSSAITPYNPSRSSSPSDSLSSIDSFDRMVISTSTRERVYFGYGEYLHNKGKVIPVPNITTIYIPNPQSKGDLKYCTALAMNNALNTEKNWEGIPFDKEVTIKASKALDSLMGNYRAAIEARQYWDLVFQDLLT
jgi:hypothetical protein